MIKTQIIKENNLLFSLKESWNNLLEKSNNRNVFLSWDWLVNWWTFYGDDKDLFIILVKSENSLIGVAPFYIKNYKILGISFRMLRILGDIEVCSEQLDIIFHPEFKDIVFNEICNSIEKFKEDWDILLLNDFRKDSFFIEALNKFTFASKLKTKIKETTINPYLKLPSNWEIYFNSLSKNQRRNYQRESKKLRREFNFCFEPFSENNSLSLDEVISTLIKLHEKKWSQELGAGVFQRDRFREFHYSIAKDLFNEGWLKMFLLWIDKEIKGVLYCYEYKNVIFGYQMGYDPDFKNYNIGKFLIYWSIKYAIESNLLEFDFLRGQSAYKYRFTNSFKNNVSILGIRKNTKGYLFYFYYIGKPRIKTVFKNIIPDKIWNYLHNRKYFHKMKA